MRRVAATAALAIALVCLLAAQTGFTPWKQADGSNLSGMVLLCDTGVNRVAAPCGGPAAPMRSLLMPFVRTGMDPYVFDVSATAKQFAISKPAAATSYRLVNPCDVDVRIRKVASMTESVTLTTGTLYLARTSEVVGTSSPEFVSLIAMKAPASTCKVELQYGDGS